MKWTIYVCECGTGFALDSFSDNGEPSCPNCVDDMSVTTTGECMQDPDIKFDRGDE
jgi:hypothetical protein